MSLPFAARFCRRLVPTALVITPVASTYYVYRNASHRDEACRPRFAALPAISQFRWASLANISFAEPAAAPYPSLSDHPAGKRVSNLPSISAAQIRATKKNDTSSSIYVTYRDGVYDISSFVASHPGGDLILMAAGGPLEAYWKLYPQHASEFVLDLLEELRVGNLEPDDEWRREHQASSKSNDVATKPSPYDTDPPRHPELIVQTTAPYTAEPPGHVLVSSQHTPNDLFYVRNHMPVPVIDEKEYGLRIVGRDGSLLATLTMDDLRNKFPKVSVSATVQCAGNRRNELNRVKKVKGGNWEIGAISNASWSGARLSDVLAHIVGDDVASGAHGAHVCFDGLDADPGTGRVYAASVPIDVVRRHPDAVLAYEMNGDTLPRDHGYPVRVVVPGIVGARAVKWLGTITLSDEESQSHWQQQDYRSFAPNVDWSNVNFDEAPSIQEMPVVSAICTHDVDVDAGTVTMNGYAWSGDGKAIIRVDVSVDGGQTWTAAQLHEKERTPRNEVYDWTLWSATIDLPKGAQNIELVCKAVDSAYNSQPDGAANIWNLRGLLNNAWHRVDISGPVQK